MAVSAAVCAVYLACFLDVMATRQGGTVLVPAPLMALLFVAFLAVLALFWHDRRCFYILIRWRYLIAAGILMACVIFRISGSSVAVWSDLLGGEPDQGVLFGVPRSVRSDEWCVFTPFAASQVRLGFPAVNDALRASPTDVTMVYGQPAWALATVFRPFLWGYLLLGMDRGLSFFWVGRLLALWLVLFELGRLVTSRDDELSALFATLVAFSPVVQWWFAVNGTAELFVFGGGLVLSLHALLEAGTRTRRWLLATLLGWLLWCYAFILYPAWQIPFAYVFGGMGVWVLLEHWWGRKAGGAAPCARQTVIPLVVCLVGWSVLALVAVRLSTDTIQSVLGTAYPGGRSETGGMPLDELMRYFGSLSTAIKAGDFRPNVSEAAGYASVFPLGIVLGAYVGWRRRDALAACVLVPTSLIAWYVLVGLPEPIARVTLLSKVTASRCIIVLGFADALLLVRALSLTETDVRRRGLAREGWHGMAFAGVGAAGCGLAICVAARLANSEAEDALQLVLTFSFSSSMAFVALLPQGTFRGSDWTRGSLLLLCSTVVLLSGLLVNPVQQGTAALTQSDLVETAVAIEGDDPGAVWMAETTPCAQALIAAGAPTINSVNTYPTLDRWAMLDPGEHNEVTYNRYAWIYVELDDHTDFELVQADLFVLHLEPDDLGKLGVRYFCSYANLSGRDTERTHFEPVAQAGPCLIYRVEGR